MSAPAPAATRVRWTARAALFLGTGTLLAVVAIAVRSPVPLFVALPLLVAPFVAAAGLGRRPLAADLTWHAEGFGPEVEAAGELRGAFGAVAGDVVVEVERPPGAVADRPLGVARAPEVVRFSTGWRFVEPTITVALAPSVACRDATGLCERTVVGRRPDLLLDRPPAEVHRMRVVRLERTTALPGETLAHRRGPSGEFFGIREAVPSDPWNRINWRASARAGRLLANEFLTENTGDMLLLLDVRPSRDDRSVDRRLLGISKAAVYGIAEALLRSKVRVGYASFGEFLDAVPLATGRGHRVRLLRAVEATELSVVAGPAERCAVSMRRFFRPGVTTLVISSWTGDPTDEVVPYLRRQGFPPVLVSPSPLPMVAGTGDLPPALEALAVRLERLERRARLAELWRYAPVIDWEDYWSLDGLVRFLNRPARRRVS